MTTDAQTGILKFEKLADNAASHTDTQAHATPAIDMAQTTFNKDYLGSISLLEGLSQSTKFRLPNLILIGDAELNKTRSQQHAHDAPQPTGDKPGTFNQATQAKELFSHTHTDNKDGGYTEQHFGPRPEDNYVLTKSAAGQFLIATKPGDKPVEIDRTEEADVRVQRAGLRDLADEHIKDPADRKAFAENMTKFEERSKQLEDIYQKEGMSAAEAAKKARQEIAKTYDRISFLLEDLDRPGSPIHEKERVMIAQQILDHAANPTTIDQGQHLTCNVTTIESRTFTRHPSDAARLIANVATTGLYIAPDNTHVKVNWDSLAPDAEAKSAHPADGERDLASQIFQVTAANIWYQKHDPSIRYEQTQEGERLYKYAPDGSRTEVTESVGFWGWLTGKQGKPERSPSLTDDALVEVGNTITGSHSNDWFFEHTAVSENTTVHIDSQADLEAKLADAKAQGKLPIVIAVHTSNEPFHTDSDGGTAGGSGGESGGWHVVNVTDFHPGPPATVAIDNQWGTGADHFGKNEITSRQLYLSMRKSSDPVQLQEFRDAIREDREHGNATVVDQLELLRLEKQSGNISDANLERQVNALVRMGARQFQQAEAKGQVDSAALVSCLHKMMDVVNLLPADRRMETIARIQENYTTPGREFTGNAFLGEWAAKVYCNSWDEYRDAQHNHSLNDDKMNRIQRVMAVYRRINDRMPAKVADHMHEILAAQKP